MIGMFTFETLEQALRRAKTSGEPGDVRELADMVMKLTQEDNDADAIWQTSEREALALLIERELKSGNEPSFVNICRDAENPEDILRQTNLTESVKDAVAKSIQKRLFEFSETLTIIRHRAKKI